MKTTKASRAQEALTVEELDALLDAIETASPTGKRNLALLTLMADRGLRVGEALALTTKDLVRDGGQVVGVKVRRGKGGKPADLTVTSRAAARIARWLTAREKLGLGNGALFCTISKGKQVRGRVTAEGFGEGREEAELTPGKPISAEYVRQALARYAERAGIERRVTPHTLRHTFATHFLREHDNLELTRKALRHSDVRTTAAIYAHLEDRDVAEAVRALRPEEKPEEKPTSEAEATAAALLASLPAEVRAALAKLTGGGE